MNKIDLAVLCGDTASQSTRETSDMSLSSDAHSSECGMYGNPAMTVFAAPAQFGQGCFFQSVPIATFENRKLCPEMMPAMPTMGTTCVAMAPPSTSPDTGSTPEPFLLAKVDQMQNRIRQAEHAVYPGQGQQMYTPICKQEFPQDKTYAMNNSPVEYQEAAQSPIDDKASQLRDAERTRGSRVDPMAWGDGVKTVMIRQIPRQYTQWMLLEEVNAKGFEGLFDFIYVPFDFKKGFNVGYGFLSFVEPPDAAAFRDAFDGTFLDKHMKAKGKPLRVHPASVQGYEANYKHFMQTKTGQKQDPQFSPLFWPNPGTRAQVAKRSPMLMPQAPNGNQELVPKAQQQAEQYRPYQASMHQQQQQQQQPPMHQQQQQASNQTICWNCGWQCLPAHNFCANCGSRVGTGESVDTGQGSQGSLKEGTDMSGALAPGMYYMPVAGNCSYGLGEIHFVVGDGAAGKEI